MPKNSPQQLWGKKKILKSPTLKRNLQNGRFGMEQEKERRGQKEIRLLKILFDLTLGCRVTPSLLKLSSYSCFTQTSLAPYNTATFLVN